MSANARLSQKVQEPKVEGHGPMYDTTVYNHSPNSDKININIQTKFLLICDAFLPPGWSVVGVYLVREWDLLVVP